MARRTKDEAERTKNAILDAAEKVFYRHGVARTSLEEIARTAGVTRGAVYWHFRDKIELCEAMMQRVFLPQEDVLERLAESDSGTPLEDLKRACCGSLERMGRDRRRQRVISIVMNKCEYVEEMAAMMKRRRACKDRMLARSRKMFERAARLKQLSPRWPPATAAVFLQSLMGGLIANAIEGRKEFDPAKSGIVCIETFFNSVRVS